PYLDGAALARAVELPFATLRPSQFTPGFQKHAGKRCGGVQLHVTDPKRFAPYAAYLRLIAAIRAQVGAEMAFRTEPYEFVHDRPAIDLLTGSPSYRALVDQGGELDAWLEADEQAARAFAEARREFLIY